MRILVILIAKWKVWKPFLRLLFEYNYLELELGIFCISTVWY